MIAKSIVVAAGEPFAGRRLFGVQVTSN